MKLKLWARVQSVKLHFIEKRWMVRVVVWKLILKSSPPSMKILFFPDENYDAVNFNLQINLYRAHKQNARGPVGI